MLVDAVTGEGRRWVASADEDEPPTRRDLVDRLCHDVVEGGVGRNVLIVIEDEGEGRLQPTVQLAEEAPREHGDPLVVLRRQQGQRPPAAGRG